MSKFSERCKYFLAENGTNVYRLSKECALECTTLQRMVTGKRLPNIEFVKRFCDVLRIPFAEKQNLLELYKIEQIGETTYYNRKCVKMLLKNLALNEASSLLESISLPKIDPYMINSYSYKVEILLKKSLIKAFEKSDNSFILTNFPASTSNFFHQLRLLNIDYPNSNVVIKHLINFKIDSDDTTFNLNILNNVLPLSITNRLNYIPKFYYSRLNQFDFSQIIFPYFIITSDEVLLISSSLQKAIKFTDIQIIKDFINEFDNMELQCSDLIHTSNNLNDAWIEYIQLHKRTDQHFYILEPSICSVNVLEKEVLIDLLNRNLKSLNINFEDIATHQKSLITTSFFTKTGVEYFCETGIFPGQLGSLMPPLPKSQRKKVLETYLNINTDSNLLNDSFSIPLNLNIEVCERERINFIYFGEDESLNISFFSIDESSICNAFYDFVTSLKSSESILTKEQEKNVLFEIIEEKFNEVN